MSETDKKKEEGEDGAVWKGPLSSVPVSMIQYCIQQCQLQEQLGKPMDDPKEQLNRSVCVHLKKGGYRYRAAKLTSIDNSLNLRLDNVVVSQKRRPKQKQQAPQQNQQEQQQAAAAANFPIGPVPSNETVRHTMGNCLVPGSSVVMIQLPESWSPLFEMQARLARKEWWRQYREKRKRLKEKKRTKHDEKQQKRKEKKAKLAAKSELLDKGAKAAKAGKKKAGGGGKKD